MIVSKVSDEFSDNTVVLEFFRWTIQLHTSLHFSLLKLLFNFYVKNTVRRQDFGAKFDLTCHNGAPVADIPKLNKGWCEVCPSLLPEKS